MAVRLQDALDLHKAGRGVEAENAYRSLLATEPRNAEALHGLGVLRAQCGDLTGAADFIGKSLEVDSKSPTACFHLGVVLDGLGRRGDALTAYERATALNPDFAEAHSNRGNALLALGRMQEAIDPFERALALNSGLVGAHYGRGYALLVLGKLAEAEVAFERTIAVKPDHVEAHCSRGIALAAMNRKEDALTALSHALALRQDFLPALDARSGLLNDLGRFGEALADADRAAAVDPDHALAHSNRGNALYAVGRLEEALAAFDRALTLDPDLIKAVCNRGSVNRNMGRLEDALADFERVLALQPMFGQAASERFYLRATLCDWRQRAVEVRDLARRVREDQLLVPWEVIVALDDPEIQLRAARRYAGPIRQTAAGRRTATHARLRIAYLSPDFRDHPTGHQTVELFERHDKARFETFGICLQSVPDHPIRLRLKGAFDHFEEAGMRSDAEIAGLLAEREIDIAVDLAGYVGMGRTKALASQSAPIAVNYFGYPGTLGADYIDYIIADRYVAPPGCEEFYAERIARLPDCYYPANSTAQIGATPSRAEAGLPEGFVFCSFNNTYKFTPEIFDIWMRLLQGVEGSVLWLFAENEAARRNLCAEAEARGVTGERLCFAGRVERERHLARMRLADLFLDTLPCNAHTTASDALWMGLPLVTCMGRSFAARVAGSMLHAVGLEELIAGDLAQYEAVALDLARSPQRLAALRDKLAGNCATTPLFDTPRLCRNIESAYATMWEIHRKGEKPRSFSVASAAC
ncbi:MAG: tetratricopeptide repeat protein [Alphaproteobacteria bacterium]|nr:tetratricopeptide repeat protein [Alphaproteobacteria bacterium]